MVNYLLDLSFDGSYFYGTQIQKNYPTLSSILLEKLNQLFKCKVDLKLCSRLDKDVSSYHFIVNFVQEELYSCEKLIYILNRLLPIYIRVNSIKKVNLKFEARRNTYQKTYIYNIHFGKYNPLEDRFCFTPIFIGDKNKFIECLNLFVGEHDFSCFYSIDDKDGKYKIISKIKTKQRKDYLQVQITARSFGRYQIRYIIGACYLYSIGKLSLVDIKNKLDGKDKSHITFKAPGNALILKKVYYKLYVKK